MDLSNSQLDLGLDLDYDKEKQEETEFQERLKIYKFKYAKKIQNYQILFICITISKCCNSLVISLLGLYF